MSSVSGVLAHLASASKRLVTAGRPSYHRLRDPEAEDTVVFVDDEAVESSDAEQRRRDRYDYFDKWFNEGFVELGDWARRYMKERTTTHRYNYVKLALCIADLLTGNATTCDKSVIVHQCLSVVAPGVFCVDAVALMEVLVFFDLLTGSDTFGSSRSYEAHFESVLRMGVLRGTAGLCPGVSGTRVPVSLIVARDKSAFSLFALTLAKRSIVLDNALFTDELVEMLQVFAVPLVVVHALLKLTGAVDNSVSGDKTETTTYDVFPLWPYMAYEQYGKAASLL